MKKVIPEKISYYCDRCNSELNDNNKQASAGSIHYVGFDYSGHAVGGNEVKFELCSMCTRGLRKYFEDFPEVNPEFSIESK